MLLNGDYLVVVNTYIWENNMADEYELDDGPKSYHVDLDTLDTVSEDVTRYQGIDHILLIVEDDPENLANKVDSAKTHYGSDFEICVCENTLDAQRELEKYRRSSPNARLDSLLDFNMNKSEISKKSIEGLYSDPTFKHYLNKGGVVVFNTGYPQYVRNNMNIMDTQRDYENVLFLITEKGVEGKDIKEISEILGFMKFVKTDKIPGFRKISEKFNYDLAGILNAVRARKR